MAAKHTKTQPLFGGPQRANDAVGLIGHKSIGPAKAAAVPPAPRKADLARTRPPRGRRTGAAAAGGAPEFGPALPESPSGWMRRASRLIAALSEAIEAGDASESTEAAIERAFAAFELGVTDKHISQTAHLVERAHRAIRDTRRNELESAYVDCAEIVHQGLPSHLARKTDLETVVAVVRRLRQEADAWTAVIDGTSELLGWADAVRGHGSQAIRVALLAEPPTSRL